MKKTIVVPILKYHKILLLFVLILVLLLCPLIEAAGTPVKYLPGFGPLPFEFETGYVGLGESEEVQLFYYFFKSESNPEVDPLILWITGGPGCGALNAITTELGPVLLDAKEYDGSLPTLSLNPYSYTKVANIIFLDSPVTGGFSYATTKEANHSDNVQMALHTHQFVQKWLVDHSEYLSNDFYVAGDSYSGISVPIITQVISDGNEAGNKPWINLKGYILGNAVTFRPDEQNYRIPHAHGLALISDELYKSLESSCGGEYQYIDQTNTHCLQHVQTFNRLVSGIYFEHILEPICNPVSTKARHLSPQRRYLNQKLGQLKNPTMLPGVKCRDEWHLLSEIWVNDETVQEALHVRKGTHGIWKQCPNYEKMPFTRTINNTIPFHASLSKKGYRSLIYSGDYDLYVPFLSTQAWIRSLNYSIDTEWRRWFVDGQVAGYVTTYSNQMTFTTIKGAGHTAPEYKPAECLAMLKRWIYYQPL
uniref:Littorine synthase n=1 Tax=Atropa belladonna TaxID=33113 RepID=A0A3B6XRA5_ATRBE|nr:littorine synthase [Atropa belladonna]QGI57842.1 littorine synthase [Atropa belladonna]